MTENSHTLLTMTLTRPVTGSLWSNNASPNLSLHEGRSSFTSWKVTEDDYLRWRSSRPELHLIWVVDNENDELFASMLLLMTRGEQVPLCKGLLRHGNHLRYMSFDELKEIRSESLVDLLWKMTYARL